jgi:hypothetical protein
VTPVKKNVVDGFAVFQQNDSQSPSKCSWSGPALFYFISGYSSLDHPFQSMSVPVNTPFLDGYLDTRHIHYSTSKGNFMA